MGIKREGGLVDPKAQAAERVLKRLGVAIKTFGLYPPQHPMATHTLEAMVVVLRPYLSTYGAFIAHVTRENIEVDGVPHGGDVFGALALYLYTRKLSAVTILPTVADQELESCLSIVGMDRISLQTAGGIEHLLWQASVSNILVMELRLDEEQEVEALGLNAFLALVGRGRLAPRERQAVVSILHSAEQTAQLLTNVYLMAPEAFPQVTPQERMDCAYEAVRTLDRLILDGPLEEQPNLYVNLVEGILVTQPPLAAALPRRLVEQAPDDTTAKFLLTNATTDELAELIIRAVPFEDLPSRLGVLLRVIPFPDRKADALISLLERRLRPPGAGPSWLSDAVRPHLAVESREPEVPPEFVFDDSLVVVDHKDIAARLGEARAIDERSVTREVIFTLVDLLRNETGEKELLEVAENLAGLLVWMVNEEEFADLTTVLEHLGQLAAAPEPQGSLATSLLRRVTEHPVLDRLLDVLWTGRETPRGREVEACLAALGGVAVTPLVHALGRELRLGMRVALCDLLVSIGRDHVDELGSFVADERWHVVRNIANILGRLQNPAAVSHLELIVAHPERRVRREVVDALDRLGTEEAQALLGRLLDDPDQRIRLQSIHALNAPGARRAMRRLLAILAAPDLLHRLFPLKVAILETLERLQPSEALPLVRRIARSSFAFGRRRRALRALARRTLVAFEGPPPEGQRETRPGGAVVTRG